ncbi:UTP-GlnB uridylyltransferase, GlnD [Chthoniobacter flavus Ellin428]|uniref:Bifunctional uridylyltransferase/uridylyl-removing enzyme n=2 Tax=Chthoniobacter flavus TaxID=191863 RepID=B4CU94_9BACT|nr:UTP-GlnB uridylyltransferase, GlnD [Chthoniobacter flavus Ellin428]TCO94835.1 UTP--GlnB (protein PII) uridylyltransferase GlnD [Chthoniobacter flavus]
MLWGFCLSQMSTLPTTLRHREKVLAHAEQQLRSQGELNSADLLSLYKKFLKIENHRIRLKHYSGGGGREICAQRASLVDIVLRHLLEAAVEEADRKTPLPKLALIALGGYGRGELNPFSDVDIMFLHEDSMKVLDSRLNDIVQHILYMLWDVGFKVGHSTRSISGAIKHANEDMLSKTALLEARFIAGQEELFTKFKNAFVEKCVDKYVDEYIKQRVENQAERHEKFGRTVYLQEPNIKNGCGGLRDYQNLLWISYFKEHVQTTAGLVEKKLLNEAERRQLDRAYDFLLRIRTELHYLNKRSTDVIIMSQQLQIANKLNYPQKNILRRSEAFMRDYYQQARVIYSITELLSERLCLSTTRSQKRNGIFGLLRKSKPVKGEEFDGFYSQDGLIYADSSNVFNQEPSRMMRLFQHMQQRGLELSPELAQLVRRRLHLVDRTFQYARNTRETFLAICSRKGQVGKVFRAMHEVDFLGRYIPEFGQLTCLVQHEFFHRYTADEHTLVCVEKLDMLVDTKEAKFAEYRKLFQKLENPAVLYLAMLLHDTGKAANARVHAEASALFAQKVARRLQLSAEQRKALVLLVDNHILLSMTAQRRNLEDPATIAEFASLIKDQANLDALMLLTLADGQGTGDENWSDWKESLVWHLYRSTTLYLADGEAFYRQRTIEREGLRALVRKKLAAEYRDEIDAHFEHMPDRYFQTYTVPEIAEHIRLFRAFLETRHREDQSPLAPAVKWISHPNKGHSEFLFCGWDRKALLARIAGSLSIAQLNILSADVFTRTDNLVLDIFRVCNTSFEAVTDPAETALVEKRLRQSMEDENFDFTAALEKSRKKRGFQLSQELDFPTRIVIDNDAHPVYTLVDIQTPDRLGLLYRLLRAIAETNVQIALSRIATEKGAAIDTFYVTDVEGRKLRSATAIAKLQKALQVASQLGSTV